MKEAEYLYQLKQNILLLRRNCLNYLQHTYGTHLSQKDWRLAANTYCKHYGPSIDRKHLKLDLPIPAAGSKVDAYHHGYLVRAILASILHPEEGLTYEDYTCIPICDVCENPLERREHQVVLYTKLNDMLPATASAPSKPNLNQALAGIRQVLDEHTSKLNKIISHMESEPIENQTVDKKPNRRRKLPDKA